VAAQKLDFVSNECGGNPCEAGANFNYDLIWQKENPVGSGLFVPVDLTGFSAKMQVRKNTGSPVIIELSTTNGRITIDAANGKITLSLSATDTAALASGMYKYDLDLTSPSSFVIRFVQGNFEVSGQITA
jgi:hypothetical protein